MVESSIRKRGFRFAGTLDKNRRIVHGNNRHERATDIGLDEVVIVKADPGKQYYLQFDDLDLTDPDNPARELAYQANRSAQVSIDFDPEQILADINAGVDLGQFWSGDELDAILGDLAGGGTEGDTEPQTDKAAELAKEWGTAVGQVWELGPHRLAVGDCTDPAVVALAIAPGEADMLFTDPPYGVSYGAKNEYLNAIAPGNRIQTPIENDQRSEADLMPFLCAFLEPTKAAMRSGATYYLCSPAGSPETTFRNALVVSGLEIRQEIVWYKNHFVLGRQDYQWIHETLLYGWKDGAAHYFESGSGAQTTVWEIARPHNSDLHPTGKPIELMERAIRNSSKPGETIYDPFGGSGSTLIAAHNLGRIARTIELDPGYAAVTLQRFRDHTNTDPRQL
jgi:DNA modification methylase